MKSFLKDLTVAVLGFFLISLPVLLFCGFWGTVIYVAVHFLRKYW